MAMEKARAAGTDAQILAQATSSDFLRACLNRTTLEAELVTDVRDACELNEVDALTLGGGELTEADAADKLFLMPEEAASVLAVCRRECLRIGVKFGDGAVYEPSPEDEERDLESKPGHAGPQTASPLESAPPLTPSLIPSRAHEAAPASSEVLPSSPSTATPAVAPNPMQDESHGASPAVASTPMQGESHGPAGIQRPCVPEHEHEDPFLGHTLMKTPDHFPALIDPKVSSAKAATASTPPKPTSSVTRAHSAKQSLRSGMPSVAGGSWAPENGMKKSKSPRSAGPPARPASASSPAPSYARVTGSFKARTEGPSAATSNGHPQEPKATTPVLEKATSPSVSRPPRKPRTPPSFANLSASLLRPTKAFLSYTSGNKENEAREQDRVNKRGLVTTQSVKLTASTRGPLAMGGGSRNLTPVAPPKQRTLSELKTARANGQPLTTEELEYLRAQDQTGGGFKARPMPKFKTPSTPASAKEPSSAGSKSNVVSSTKSYQPPSYRSSLSPQPMSFSLATASAFKSALDETDGAKKPSVSHRAKSTSAANNAFTVFSGPAK